VRKNDKILISATGFLLNVVRVDPFKRDYSGLIELLTSGVD